MRGDYWTRYPRVHRAPGSPKKHGLSANVSQNRPSRRRSDSRSHSLRSERSQTRTQPVDNAGEQFHRRPSIVLAVGIFFDGNFNAAPTSDEQEALDMGVDIELIFGPVGRVQLELAGLHIIQVEHLDGIVADDGWQGFRIATAV